MAGHSWLRGDGARAGGLLDHGGWGKHDMFFETEPHRWGFQQAGGHRPADPMMADSASRARPKFSSFDASRPGLFAPRPFQREPLQRERRSSDGASCTSEEDRHSQASSSGSCGEQESRPPPAPAAPRERIIPIRLEGDDPQEQQERQEPPPPPQRPARRHERRDTVNGATIEPPRDERDGRDVRAQSCPVTSPSAGGGTGAARGGAKFAPLKVGEALASQQREAKQAYGKPSYSNMSPKPFSPGAKPFQAASFGMFGSPTRSSEPPVSRPPPVPPKPSAAEIRAAKQQPKQPQQTQQQQQQQQPQKSAKEEALGRIATIHTDLDPLTRRLEAFEGARGDKEYLYLDEMLTRGLIKLDGLETGGDAEVRSARKEAVRRIEESLGTLERRSVPREAAMQNGGAVVNGEKVVVKVNGGVAAAERRAASAPPQGLARAEPAIVSGHDAQEGDATPTEAAGAGPAQRRVSAEEMSRR